MPDALLQRQGNELTTLGKMSYIADNSRLSCHIPVTPLLHGMQIAIVRDDERRVTDHECRVAAGQIFTKRKAHAHTHGDTHYSFKLLLPEKDFLCPDHPKSLYS